MEISTENEKSVADDIGFDLFKENLINQMIHPELGIKKNFLKEFISTIDEYIEGFEIEDDETKQEIRKIRFKFVDLIRDKLEEYWDIEFDFDNVSNIEKVISEYYKLYINRDEVLINALTQFLKASSNRNDVIREMELNPSADDVSTVSYKKLFRRNDATILSNISDVIEHIIDDQLTTIEPILKKANKYKNKKYLERCLKYLDYVDDSDNIYNKFNESMDVGYISEISVTLTDNLGHIFEMKKQ